MKKIYPVIFILAIVLITLIFSSCISIERVIKINKNGSGNEELTIQYGKDFFDLLITSLQEFDSTKGKAIADSIYKKDFFSDKIKGNFKGKPGIKLNDVFVNINSDSSLFLKINYNFDSLKKLDGSLQSIIDENESMTEGKTSIIFDKNSDKIIFRYKYESDNSADTNRSLRNAFASFFKDQKIIYTITFPFKIVKSNATRTNGQTLTWEYDLEKLMLSGINFDLEAEMKK